MEKKQTKTLSKYLERPAAVRNTIATFVSVHVWECCGNQDLDFCFGPQGSYITV